MTERYHLLTLKNEDYNQITVLNNCDQNMDLDSLQADLNALRKLYGLLQIDGSGGQSSPCESLDDASRLFLKKLLDDAAERVFETHIKIMAENWRSLLGTSCLGQLEESKDIVKPSHLDQNIKESVNAFLLKDEQPLRFRTPNESPSLNSQLRGFATELQGRKKRCLTCAQGNRLEEANKTHINKASTEACDLRILDYESEAKQSMEPGNVDFRSSDKESVTSPKKVAEDPTTKEVDNAIRRIESLIPALHRLANPVRAPEAVNLGSFKKTTLVFDLDSVGEAVTTSKQTHDIRQSKQPNQGNEKCANYMFLEKPLGRIPKEQIQRTSESYRNVAGQVPYHNQEMSILPSQLNEDNINQYQNHQREGGRMTPTSRSSLLHPLKKQVNMQDSVHRSNQVQYKGSSFREKCSSLRKKTGGEENYYYSSPQGDYMSRLNESEETRSDSPASSSWTAVDTSSSSSPSRTTQTTTGCSSENEESESSHYKDADDFDSSKTRSVTSQSGSSKYDPSFSSSVRDYGGGEDDLSPYEDYQSSHHSVQHGKASKFGRLKNKLGFIFHHHHHHHHHRHGKSDEVPPGPWKRFGKMFNHVEKKSEPKNSTVDPSKKGKHVVKSRPHKQQIGHFHALVEGLMRHVGRSNKSKLGSRRGKKTNLWQNRVKLTNKARVKLQGRDKKHKLIAPKSH